MSETRRPRKNQKIIEISKETTFPKGKRFLSLSEDSILSANKYMLPNSRIVWSTLLLNVNGFQWLLSPTYFTNLYGMDKKAVHTAIKDLIELGYLEQTDDDGLFYTLHSWVEIDEEWFSEYKERRKKKKKEKDSIPEEIIIVDEENDDLDDYEI